VRFCPALVVFIALFVSLPARASENASLDRAEQEVARIRGLVEAGAMPRSSLESAETALAEAQDEVVLSERLYGKTSLNELTDDAAQGMVKAAERQLARQQERIDALKKLIDEGVKPRTELTPLLEELDRRRQTLGLAESRVRLLGELEKMARLEVEVEQDFTVGSMPRVSQRYDGDGSFNDNDFHRVNAAYQSRFGRPLPVSAYGMSAVHRALGFDHRGRVDVAIDPNDSDGRWLRAHLEAQKIPYFAFAAAVPGKATGAHIHLGTPSPRLLVAAVKPAAKAPVRSVAAARPRRVDQTVSTYRAD
jgi:hypothetical protein